MEQAKRDLVADGLDVREASFVLELDMLYGGQFHVKRTLSPLLAMGSVADVHRLCSAFEKEFSEAFSPFVVNPEGGVLRLKIEIRDELLAVSIEDSGRGDQAQAVQHEIGGVGLSLIPAAGILDRHGQQLVAY